MYTRHEYAAICSHCVNRRYDRGRGVVCGLTDRPADFEEVCLDFVRDKHVKPDRRQALEEAAKKEQEYTASKAIVHGLISLAGVFMLASTDMTLISLGSILYGMYGILTGFDNLPQKKKNDKHEA